MALLRATTIAGPLLLVALARAPMQCARPPRPEMAREETPGEALWMLAEQFAARGDAPARQATLRFLIARYPSSRFAVRARDELAAGGASTGGDDGGR